jgi:hypothetical protein
VNDYQAAVRVPDISSYLASKGWERDGDWRGASIWRLGGQARLLIPDLQQFDDAGQLIEEAVAKIARHEARPERDVWQDIAEPNVDAQFYRLHPDAPSGSIPLPFGVKAATGIQELMKAAAATAEQGGKQRFEGRRTRQVDAFLRKVMLGSAAPGSYILTARVPTVPVNLQQELFDFDEARELTGRAVIAQLHTAVSAARTAAEQVLGEHGDLAAVYDHVESGVSANLCWALCELGGEGRNLPFEIGFSWARGVPGQGSAQEVRFTSAMPGILARAGNELAMLARTGTARIRGLITDLHDERNEPARIKVRGELSAEGAARLPHRSVWVVLNEAQYQEAIEAHRGVRQVEAEGQFTTTLRRLELVATAFRVPA